MVWPAILRQCESSDRRGELTELSNAERDRRDVLDAGRIEPERREQAKADVERGDARRDDALRAELVGLGEAVTVFSQLSGGATDGEHCVQGERR